LRRQEGEGKTEIINERGDEKCKEEIKIDKLRKTQRVLQI
jgi:hypothetical protein